MKKSRCCIEMFYVLLGVILLSLISCKEDSKEFLYKIKFEVSEGGTVESSKMYAVEGEQFILTAIPDESYEFVNWTIDEEVISKDNPYITTMKGDYVYKANFERKEPIVDNEESYQNVPYVSWELASSVCKAGNEVGFLAKYYTTAEGVSISHSEVWAMVTRSESAAATQKLVSSPAYTKTFNFTDTVRGYHLLAEFPHSQAVLNGKEYYLNASFQTSRTLAPITWSNPETWSEDKFVAYYPETFKTEFRTHMVKTLTNSDNYLEGLRQTYLNYDFTAEQVIEINSKYPRNKPIPYPLDGEDKKNLWYAVNTNEVVGYYYILEENGVSKEIEVSNKEEAVQAGVDISLICEVYKAPHWLFCRYSKKSGTIITSLREEYRPMWSELLSMIPFESWIYNRLENKYLVEFNRKYALEVQIKVIDNKGGYR